MSVSPRTILFFVLGLFLPLAVGAVAPAGSTHTHRSHHSAHYPEIEQAISPRLQHGLEQTMERLGLMPYIKRQQLGVAIADITNLRAPHVASLNGDKMFYAASLPKIAILLAAFVQIEQGRMRFTPRTYQAMSDMIRLSSNEAATEVLNMVGRDRIQDVLLSPRFHLYDPEKGGLWVGKEYGPRAAFKRDPLQNLSHAATANQTIRFYYLLETNRLVSPVLTRQMKSMLSEPGIHHKFVKGLEENRPGARIFRKSGSWSHWHSDSAIVESGGKRFIVAALTDQPKGTAWLEEMITPLHDLIVPAGTAGGTQTASNEPQGHEIPWPDAQIREERDRLFTHGPAAVIAEARARGEEYDEEAFAEAARARNPVRTGVEGIATGVTTVAGGLAGLAGGLARIILPKPKSEIREEEVADSEGSTGTAPEGAVAEAGAQEVVPGEGPAAGRAIARAGPVIASRTVVPGEGPEAGQARPRGEPVLALAESPPAAPVIQVPETAPAPEPALAQADPAPMEVAAASQPLPAAAVRDAPLARPERLPAHPAVHGGPAVPMPGGAIEFARLRYALASSRSRGTPVEIRYALRSLPTAAMDIPPRDLRVALLKPQTGATPPPPEAAPTGPSGASTALAAAAEPSPAPAAGQPAPRSTAAASPDYTPMVAPPSFARDFLIYSIVHGPRSAEDRKPLHLAVRVVHEEGSLPRTPPGQQIASPPNPANVAGGGATTNPQAASDPELVAAVPSPGPKAETTSPAAATPDPGMASNGAVAGVDTVTAQPSREVGSANVESLGTRPPVRVAPESNLQGTGKEMADIMATTARRVDPSETIEIRYALKSAPNAPVVHFARRAGRA